MLSETTTLYAPGTRVGDVRRFQSAAPVFFHCPDHPRDGRFFSWDPYFSEWKLMNGTQCPEDCLRDLDDYLLSTEYQSVADGTR